MPAASRTSLPKVATIFSVILLVSLGLCGANLALFDRFGSVSGGAQPPDRPVWASMTLIFASFFELLGIAVGALGLLTTGVIGIVRALLPSPKDPQ